MTTFRNLVLGWASGAVAVAICISLDAPFSITILAGFLSGFIATLFAASRLT